MHEFLARKQPPPKPTSFLTLAAQVLAASAKSFEEFVEDQLREDGSGLVLRREGATGLLVPRGKTLTQAFVVAAGCYLCWEFRIKVRKTTTLVGVSFGLRLFCFLQKIGAQSANFRWPRAKRPVRLREKKGRVVSKSYFLRRQDFPPIIPSR